MRDSVVVNTASVTNSPPDGAYTTAAAGGGDSGGDDDDDDDVGSDADANQKWSTIALFVECKLKYVIGDVI